MGECCSSRPSISSSMRRDPTLNLCPKTSMFSKPKHCCSRVLISQRLQLALTVTPKEARASLATLLQRARLTTRRCRVDEWNTVCGGGRSCEFRQEVKLFAMPLRNRRLPHHNTDVMFCAVVDKRDVRGVGERFAVHFDRCYTA